MKIIEAAKRVARKTLAFNVDKAAAPTFISRPLLPDNAAKWAAWAKKWGVPNPVSAAEMHVTVMSSGVALKTPLKEHALNIDCKNGAVFAMFGPQEQCLVFTFQSWELYDRNWDLQNLGAVPTWPTYRPHITLSYDATGYELPDEAMQDVPSFVVLGPEVMETAKDDPSDQVDDEAEPDYDSVFEIDAIIVLKAQECIKAEGDKLPAPLLYDMADVAKGRASGAVLARLAKADWAPAEVRKARSVPVPKETRKRVERELTISVSQLPEDIAKKLNHSDVAKANDEEHIVMGIASVSTVEGELVKDLHGDKVKTQALVEFNRSIITGSRAGKFDHEGEVCTEVVAGLVLTEDWQKSLGIDLGFEPYLVEIHVPDPVDWAEVKKGDWMLSVAGTMWYYEDADADV